MKINDLQSNQSVIIDFLQKKFQLTDYSILSRDSLLVFDNNSPRIFKFPVKQAKEEVYIIDTLSSLGINTPKIINSCSLNIGNESVSFYAMERLNDIQEHISQGAEYFSFVSYLFSAIKTQKLNGFGKIYTDAKILKYEYSQEKELFLSVVKRTAKRNFWTSIQIHQLENEITKSDYRPIPILVHNDIFNNILFQTTTNKFYIVDPQTSISSANEYWDLSMFMLYSYINGYKDFNHLLKFHKPQDIDHFYLTSKIICFERMSFYSYYSPKYLNIMQKYLDLIIHNQLF